MKPWPAHSERRSYPAQRSGASVLSLLGFAFLTALQANMSLAETHTMMIDDFGDPHLTSELGTRWRAVSDRVMGGVSEASVVHSVIDDRPCLRLTGDVRLENDGGFVQAALDLTRDGEPLDATNYAGIRLVARGNGESYSVHLRTPDNIRPWQSYRAQFVAGPHWQTIDLPFATFAPYRVDAALDTARLRRIGLVAIGRRFHADLAVSSLSLFR